MPKLYKILPLLMLALIGCAGKNIRQAIKDDASQASGLELYRNGDCWVANVVSPGDSTQNLGVYIFPDTDDAREIPDIPNAKVLTPSNRQNILLYTSVYSSALKELHSQELIKAVGDAEYFTDKDILSRLEQDEIINVGSQQEPVYEKIIAAKPDLIIVSHYDGADFSKLEKLGIPIIYMRESSEVTPLGKAEWIKLLGLVAGKKDAADKIYKDVCTSYTSLKEQVSDTKEKPKVMAETMYEGTWYVAGGKSYAAALIEDAGGKYIWDDDNSSDSLSKGFEAMIDRGADADIWLIKWFGDLTLKELEAQDSRYMLFKPAKTGGVWSVNTQAKPFFDETPFHPELILKDYIAIFHPGLIANVPSPRYFSKIK
ncbi:MAG: ABC transporter substrate-binding protein [Muribaculaceae bacterium]|nr:ABC transporter substrate-binding protein [Muribaculaceae bacterium]